MKKLLSLVLLSLLMMGIAFGATPGYRQSPGTGYSVAPGVGEIRGSGKYISEPHRTFRLVRYVPASSGYETSLTAESIVIWDSTSDDGVTITTTATSYDSRVAGITANIALTHEAWGNTAAEDVGKRNWTWLQTYGLAEVRVAGAGAMKVGDALGTSVYHGEAGNFVASATNPQVQGNAGFWLDNGTAAANNVEVFLKCE